MSDAPDRRRPRSVYGVGEEPDARITLANERTALAWLRTALALVAGGIAILLLRNVMVDWALLRWLAVLSCAAGAFLAVGSVVRWARVERAARLRAAIPAPGLLLLVGIGAALIGIGIAFVLLMAL